MVITITGYNGKKNRSIYATACIAGMSSYFFGRKTLVLQLIDKDIDSVEAMLVGTEEQRSFFNNGLMVNNDGIDGLMSAVTSNTKLTQKDFEEKCMALRENNKLDIAEMSKTYTFEQLLLKKMDQVKAIIRNAKNFYDDIFVLLPSKNTEVIQEMNESEIVDTSIYCIRQGHLHQAPTYGKNQMFVITDYEEESVYGLKSIKKAYKLNSLSKIDKIAHNVGAIDASNGSKLLKFISNNKAVADEDVNYVWMQDLKRIINKANEDIDIPKVEEDLLLGQKLEPYISFQSMTRYNERALLTQVANLPDMKMEDIETREREVLGIVVEPEVENDYVEEVYEEQTEEEFFDESGCVYENEDDLEDEETTYTDELEETNEEEVENMEEEQYSSVNEPIKEENLEEFVEYEDADTEESFEEDDEEAFLNDEEYVEKAPYNEETEESFEEDEEVDEYENNMDSFATVEHEDNFSYRDDEDDENDEEAYYQDEETKFDNVDEETKDIEKDKNDDVDSFDETDSFNNFKEEFDETDGFDDFDSFNEVENEEPQNNEANEETLFVEETEEEFVEQMDKFEDVPVETKENPQTQKPKKKRRRKPKKKMSARELFLAQNNIGIAD